MFCPPQSPDLNPTENVWGYSKACYRKLSIFAKNEDGLFEMILGMWNNLPQSYFQTLVKSMPTGASTVLDRRGQSTKYEKNKRNVEESFIGVLNFWYPTVPVLWDVHWSNKRVGNLQLKKNEPLSSYVP